MQIFYYKDELNDEFSSAVIEAKKIDGSYNYSHNSFKAKLGRFFWYGILARPLGLLYLKIKYHNRIVNKKVLKEASKEGYYLYGNHTNDIADPFVPSKVAHPKGVYVIVHPNNVSMPVLGKLTPYMGALPLPDDMDATKNFVNELKNIAVNEKKVIAIYPEAHIWPFYTKIRPFKDMSFRYPVQHNKPVYCFTNTYQKRRFGKGVNMITYVDGPFYPDKEVSAREAKKKLRDQVYNAMCERSKNSNVEINKFIKADDSENKSHDF